MKPIKLSFSGINSYIQKQTIDFEKLADQNIFGIFGETGSGKSSILDCIIIALYGSSDRDSIGNMINVNCNTAYVEFEFSSEVKGVETRFLIKRRFKLRKNGGYKHDAELIDITHAVTLADMSDKVNAHILKIIGLGKREFQRCLALPQGEFDKFLLDAPAERKKTIAKLFNLEQYGSELIDRLKKKRDIFAQKKISAEEKIMIITGDVIPEDLSPRKKLLAKELKQLEKENTSLKKGVAIIKEEYGNKVRFIDISKQYSSITANKHDITKMREKLEISHKYSALKSDIDRKSVFEEDNVFLKKELEETIEILKQETARLKDMERELQKKQKEEQSILIKIEQSKNFNEKENEKLETKNKLVMKNKELLAVKNQIITTVQKLNKQKVVIEKSIEQEQRKLDSLDNKIAEMQNDGSILLAEERRAHTQFLTSLQQGVQQQSLDEVKQYKIYKEVFSVKIKINKQIEKLNELLRSEKRGATDKSRVQSLTEFLVEKSRCLDNIIRLNYELGSVRAGLDEKNADTTDNELSLQENEKERLAIKIAQKIDLVTIQLSAKKLRENILQLEKELSLLKQRISSLEKTATTNEVRIKENTKTIALLQGKIDEFVSTHNVKQSSLKNIDVYPVDQLVKVENKIREWDKEYNYIEKEMSKVAGFANITVEEKDVITKTKQYEDNQENIKQTSIALARTVDALEKQKRDGEKLLELQKELQEITKEHNTVLDLMALVGGGALLEYVSEEYLYLVCDFANKYIEKISRGKFLLKFNGEFSVIDNFNAGIIRGIKTLSGGERFMISLGLALGISQSIAVNNRKNFNFFFIDEGFGSLSGDYTDNVLDSFHQLICLNFTVGFISHVDKLKEAIQNKLIVRKKSNEEGSVIEQIS